MGDYFSLEIMLKYFPKILASFPTTLLIVVVAMLAGIVIGLITAFIRIHKIPVLYQISSIYISFIRGTPQIIQLFIVYYGLPVILQSLTGVDMRRVDALYFVLVAYGLNEGAYLSELFRGGLQAVPVGQYEAGYAAGLSEIQTFRRIIIPQAARVVLPGFGVQLIALFQGTSLASTVGVMDLMGKAGQLGQISRHSVENYASAAIIFVIVSFLLEFVFKRVEVKLDYTGKGVKKQ